MFGFQQKAKTIRIRVNTDLSNGRQYFERGKIFDWDETDARQMVAKGVATLIDNTSIETVSKPINVFGAGVQTM